MNIRSSNPNEPDTFCVTRKLSRSSGHGFVEEIARRIIKRKPWKIEVGSSGLQMADLIHYAAINPEIS